MKKKKKPSLFLEIIFVVIFNAKSLIQCEYARIYIDYSSFDSVLIMTVKHSTRRDTSALNFERRISFEDSTV